MLIGNQIYFLCKTISFWSEPCNVVSELHDVSVIKEEGISFAVSKNYLVAFCELATLVLRINKAGQNADIMQSTNLRLHTSVNFTINACAN